MFEAIVGWAGVGIGWILAVLYMRGKLWQFPFYNRIISWFYANPMVDSLNNTEEFLSDLREAIVNQILNNQPQLFDAIAKQRIILANQEREPVAIFLNPEIFKELLRNALGDGHLDEIENLYDAVHGLDIPIGHLGVLPIYVTELLTAAPIFVAGGINWNI